ncbi:PD-(D/E)XK nuclease family protein [candidate division WOR-3 bacterium]|nr:PD-(D/E)XK nuclease family protein [candidate division WOR-3 bacterium]
MTVTIQGISSKIKIIPIEQPFLPTLASYIWDRFNGYYPDLSQILIIFPSKRNRYYFRRYLLQSSEMKGIIPPTILTVQELIDLLFERLGGRKGKDLERLERNLILKYVVDSLKIEFWKDIDFLRFISIGNRLLTFFDELLKTNITLENIEELKEQLHFPERYVEKELTITRSIFNEYRKVLGESGYTDTEYKYELIMSGFKPELLKGFDYIFISGLLAPTKVECKIIKDILDNLKSELILHSSKDDIKEDITSPYYSHNKFILSLGASVEDTEVISEQSSVNGENKYTNNTMSHNCRPAKGGAPTIHITKVKSQIEEVLYIKYLLSNLIGRYEPHRIAIILTDRTLVLPIKTALEAEGYNFNISMGIPFSQNLLYSFLFLLSDVVKKDFHYKEFLSLIKHPLMKNAVLEGIETRPIIYEIERQMIKENRVFFKFEDFKDEEYKPLIGMIEKFTDRITEKTSFSLYVNGIEEILFQLLSCNPEFLESGILGIGEFLKQIHKIDKIIIREDIFSAGIEKLDLILRTLKDGEYPVYGDPFSGIQLIGVLEARNLDFDCVILPSMNEGIFPARSEKDLFVPPHLRKESGMTYDKERENLYYYYFTQLIEGKQEVYLSYVEKEERDVCSRFISFLCDKGIKLYDSPVAFGRGKERRKEPVQKDESLIRKLEKMKYTPSSLRDYRVCPYRFYLKYVTMIREPSGIVEEAGALEWGNIIHKTLRGFYSKDFPSGFFDKKLEDTEEILYNRMEKTMKEELYQPKADTIFDLELYRRQLERFLIQDKKRFEKGYSIHSLEKPLDYVLSSDGKNFRLGGMIDRIDQYNEKYCILDYKTGRKIGKKYYRIGEEFTEFQLPLYALIFSEENFGKIGGLVYYYISREKTEVVDIMEEGYLSMFRDEILIPTINEIINPTKDFPRTNDEKRCRTCAYKGFCGK